MCVCLGGVSLVVLLAVGTLDAGDEPSPFVKNALGEKALDILKNATKVEVFRIKPAKTENKNEKTIAGYPIIGKAKKKGKEFTAKVTKVLFEEKTYKGQSARCFEPGVAFRIWHEKQAVDVVICFRCTNFAIGVMGKEQNEDEEELHGFGPRLEPFLSLAKEALPDDKDIQALK
jgi:hypothetical protein